MINNYLFLFFFIFCSFSFSQEKEDLFSMIEQEKEQIELLPERIIYD